MNLKHCKKIKDSELTLLGELNSLLAEEYQAWYQYHIVQPFLVGDNRTDVQEFFEEAAKDELDDHADKLINRISELSDSTTLPTPESWALNAQSKFMTAPLDVNSQLLLNLKAEQEAIEHYQRVIILAEQALDFVTADILKKIIADEEEHYSDLTKFIKDNNYEA